MFKRKESLNFYRLLIRAGARSSGTRWRPCAATVRTPPRKAGDFVKVKERGGRRPPGAGGGHQPHLHHPHRPGRPLPALIFIDDLADYAWTTVKELRIYDIPPDEHLAAMSATLLQMADGLLTCVQNLERITPGWLSGRPPGYWKNTLNVQFHQSIAELFTSDDFKKSKYREICSHMNHASDKGDCSADILLTYRGKSSDLFSPQTRSCAFVVSPFRFYECGARALATRPHYRFPAHSARMLFKRQAHGQKIPADSALAGAAWILRGSYIHFSKISASCTTSTSALVPKYGPGVSIFSETSAVEIRSAVGISLVQPLTVT